MNKVIRDGMVAVLYSPGYGAGWYSWNTKFSECLFHPDIVALVEKKNEIEETLTYTELRRYENKDIKAIVKQIEDKAKELWGEEFYAGGARDLSIEWVREGTVFKIKEYDGSESLKFGDSDWAQA